MSPKQYQEYLKSINPKSPLWKNVALAFLVGGAICCLGQALSDWYRFLGLKLEDAATATSVSLVFLSALFTGLGLYHKLARHAGAGTLVPITGFANAVASPAIDFRAEGVVTGTQFRFVQCIARKEVQEPWFLLALLPTFPVGALRKHAGGMFLTPISAATPP